MVQLSYPHMITEKLFTTETTLMLLWNCIGLVKKFVWVLPLNFLVQQKVD